MVGGCPWEESATGAQRRRRVNRKLIAMASEWNEFLGGAVQGAGQVETGAATKFLIR